ncbi:MAG: hypothetical protein ACYCOS_08015 [Sulfobacillus sp.]
MGDGRRRLIGWLGTVVVALSIGQALTRHWAVFPACLVLLGLISLTQGGLRAVLLPSRSWAISDLTIELVQGLAIGGVLALALTLAQLLLGVAPSPLIPALVWPTVSFWPEPAGRIHMQRFAQRASRRRGHIQ